MVLRWVYSSTKLKYYQNKSCNIAIAKNKQAINCVNVSLKTEFWIKGDYVIGSN